MKKDSQFYSINDLPDPKYLSEDARAFLIDIKAAFCEQSEAVQYVLLCYAGAFCERPFEACCRIYYQNKVSRQTGYAKARDVWLEWLLYLAKRGIWAENSGFCVKYALTYLCENGNLTPGSKRCL